MTTAPTVAALVAVIRNALDFANRAAGEGIEIDGLSPEDFLMGYSMATGDEDWDCFPDRIAAVVSAALSPAATEPVATDKSTGWLIWKDGRGWYRPDAQGYTNDVRDAGRYSHEEAIRHSHPNGPNGPRDGMTIKHESEAQPTHWMPLPEPPARINEPQEGGE